jgi:hypothetical protein
LADGAFTPTTLRKEFKTRKKKNFFFLRFVESPAKKSREPSESFSHVPLAFLFVRKSALVLFIGPKDGSKSCTAKA